MESFFNRTKTILSKSRLFLFALVMVLSSFIGSISSSQKVHAAIGSITQYSVPSTWSYVQPDNLTLGSDGNIWFTSKHYWSVIGKLTPSSGTFKSHGSAGGTGALAITSGPNGNIWFGDIANTQFGTGRVTEMSTNGVVLNQYGAPGAGYSAPKAMTTGPDGSLWYIASDSSMASISASGASTSYAPALPSGQAGTVSISSLAAGPDGNIWYTIVVPGSYKNAIGKISPSGTSSYYTIPTYNAQPFGITAGIDGNLWFTEKTGNKIGKITIAGSITEYTLPTTYSNPSGITPGSDGALWFTEAGKIGRITTQGVITEYIVPGGLGSHIITGSDGAVWFSNPSAGTIGRMATELSNQTITFDTAAPTNVTMDTPPYTPTASASSGLPVTITVDSSSSSVCSIDSSGSVSFQSPGTCTLNADQPGDADYSAAPQVQQSFNVLPVSADSSVAISCPSVAMVESTITCTITVANDGPAASQNTSLSALFSSSLADTSVSGDATLSGQNITWATPLLAPSDSVTFTFSAKMSTTGKAYFSAALLQNNPDPDSSNNLVTNTIVVN